MSHPDGADRARDEVQDSGPVPPGVPPEVSSEALLRGQREITILHAGDRYRLRITANDKLILTK